MTEVYKFSKGDNGLWGIDAVEGIQSALLYEPQFTRKQVQAMCAYMNKHGYLSFEELAEKLPQIMESPHD